MERVWGGRRLETLYGKRLPSAALIGESWEIVDRPEAQSVVHDGPLCGATLQKLWCKHPETASGNVPEGPSSPRDESVRSADRTGVSRFPILAKLLDAQENLSLQVHPPAKIAQKLGGESKSE